MYNKIFTKILDSSIWLEPTPTRIVWITLLAAMDENGFCAFAAVGNVAGRARVTVDEAREALDILGKPDPESSDPTNDGRRVERVPGGWIVLNAIKYREIVTRANAQEKTNERVKRYREKKRSGNADETVGNGSATLWNGNETPSEAYTEAEVEEQVPVAEVTADSFALSNGDANPKKSNGTTDPRYQTFLRYLDHYWKELPDHTGKPFPMDKKAGRNLKLWLKENPHITEEVWWAWLENMYASENINSAWDVCDILCRIRKYADGPLNKYNQPLLVNGAKK